MNNYTCKYDAVEVKDYCCIKHFVSNILVELFSDDTDDFVSTSIVVNGELAQDLLRLLLSIEVDGKYFDISNIEFDPYDYDKEYVIDITNDMDIACVPAYAEMDNYEGYLPIESDYVYLYEETSEDLMDEVHCDGIVIFGFEE